MKTIRVKEIPNGYDSFVSSEISNYWLEILEELGVEEARYWYGTAPYEGTGKLLMLVSGKWYYHDMSHCSCYGPTENVMLVSGYDTLEALLASCTDALREELDRLVWPLNWAISIKGGE